MLSSDMPRNILISTKNHFSSKTFNKYNNHNNLEVPDMVFSEKEGIIKMSLLKKIDDNSLFDSNNNILLQKIIDNLICSKISSSDYDDIHKYLIFKSLQISLEYLVSKKDKIIKSNKELQLNIDKIQKKNK